LRGTCSECVINSTLDVSFHRSAFGRARSRD
jgi:hypothetical protein